MTTIINGSSPSITFSDSTTQTTAFTTGAVTQSTIGTNVAGTGPAFSVYPGASQTFTSGTATTMVNNTELYDIGGCFNNTGSTVTLNGISVPAYSFAPNVAGYYLFSVFANDETAVGISRFFLTISKTGGTSESARVADVALSTVTAIGGSVMLYMNGTTDYVNVSVYMAGTTCTYGAGPTLTRFTGALVRAA